MRGNKKPRVSGAFCLKQQLINQEKIMTNNVSTVNDKDPILCAISARVIVAIDRISDGRITEALSALEQIENFLPKPNKNEMLCAEAAAERGALIQRKRPARQRRK